MWRQLFDGHVPSIGYEVIDQIEEFMCHGEGDLQGQLAHIDDEMRDHIIECYRIHPLTGRRAYNEAVLSRAKGRSKSEISSWIATAESFGRVRFDGWDANGQPVAKRVTSPLVKCLATEEGQAGSTFKTIAFMAGEWGKDRFPEFYGATAGIRQYQSASALYLPWGGEVRRCTSGSASKDGGLESHIAADETHLYVLPELREMYAIVMRNLGKARFDADPWLHQTSTACKLGEKSVLEETLALWRRGELSEAVYVNHREAKGRIDIRDTEHTKRQLVQAYGEASKWMDIDRKLREMRDVRICPDDATAARYYLNRSMSGRDAWIAKDVHERQTRPGVANPSPREVLPGEAIALGFDGSINDDTTVLRGSCMSDGYLFRIGSWPKPEGAAGIGWEVPRADVLATVREAMARYAVIRGYFDPHEWRSDIAQLQEEFGPERVSPWATSKDTPMSAALDRLYADLMNGTVCHDGDPLAAEHYGNVYVRMKGNLRLVRKEYPNSPRKIDSVVGDALAYEARADALAAGWTTEPQASIFFLPR